MRDPWQLHIWHEPTGQSNGKSNMPQHAHHLILIKLRHIIYRRKDRSQARKPPGHNIQTIRRNTAHHMPQNIETDTCSQCQRAHSMHYSGNFTTTKGTCMTTNLTITQPRNHNSVHTQTWTRPHNATRPQPPKTIKPPKPQGTRSIHVTCHKDKQ